MLSNRSTILLVIMAFVSFPACSDSGAPSPFAEESHGGTDADDQLVAYGIPDPLRKRTHDVTPQDVTAFGALRVQALQLITSDAPFALRDRSVRALLKENDAFALAHYVEQFAAVRMLQEALREDDNRNIEAIAFYSDILVENESPEADLLLGALTALAGRWTTDRIARAAASTIESGLLWTEKVCPGCNVRQGKAPDDTFAAEDPAVITKRTQIVSAVAGLQTLARP